VNVDRTITLDTSTGQGFGELTSQFVGEPQLPGAPEPSIRFGTYLVLNGPEAGYYSRDVKLWLLDGAGSGMIVANLGGCDATAMLVP
jgi:hypothetical protein